MIKVTNLRRFKSFFTEQSKSSLLVLGACQQCFLGFGNCFIIKCASTKINCQQNKNSCKFARIFRKISLYVPTYMFCRIMYVSLVFLYNWQGRFLSMAIPQSNEYCHTSKMKWKTIPRVFLFTPLLIFYKIHEILVSW